MKTEDLVEVVMVAVMVEVARDTWAEVAIVDMQKMDTNQLSHSQPLFSFYPLSLFIVIPTDTL